MSEKVVVSCSSHPTPQRASAPHVCHRRTRQGADELRPGSCLEVSVPFPSGSRSSFIFWTCPQVNVSQLLPTPRHLHFLGPQ